MSHENPNGEVQFFAMYTGVVVERIDPMKLARVRVRVPGLLEPKSGWCLPMGSPGAGGTRVGLKWVPPLGAEVNIFFKIGDPDHPYYLPGNWGLLDDGTEEGLNETPGGGKQIPIGRDLDDDGNPPAALDATPQQAADMVVGETPSWLLAVDEQLVEGKRKGSLFLRHKATGDVIEYDGTAQAWLVQGTSVVDVKCDGIINLEANQVQINGRIVRNTEDPI